MVATQRADAAAMADAVLAVVVLLAEVTRFALAAAVKF
jgi:hypothetical protein